MAISSQKTCSLNIILRIFKQIADHSYILITMIKSTNDNLSFTQRHSVLKILKKH